MSTIQDRFDGIEAATIWQYALAGVVVVGMVAVTLSATFLYATFGVMANEVFANAGVFETVGRAEMVVLETMFEIPVIASTAVFGTYTVNLVGDESFGLKTAALVGAGGWFMASVAHVWLIGAGVL